MFLVGQKHYQEASLYSLKQVRWEDDVHIYPWSTHHNQIKKYKPQRIV